MIAAAVSLAIGIGATSVILALAQALLLSGAPGVSEPQGLAGVYTSTSPNNPYGGTSYLNGLDLRASSRAFADLTAYYPTSCTLIHGDTAQTIPAEAVAGNYFSLLGVVPARGRLLRRDDDRRGTEPVAVVSYTFWRHQLAAVNDLAAAKLMLNGARFVVVGVAAEGFRGPSFRDRTEVWVPLAALPKVASGPTPAGILQDRGAQWLSVVGRLRAGISVFQAQEELEAIRRRLEKEEGSAAWGRPITVTDWREVALGMNRGRSRQLIGMFLLGGVLILTLACVNAANLLTGRFLEREPEVALRLALGASRTRAALPLVGDCLVLGLGAYAGSIGAQASGLRLLLQMDFPLTRFDLRLTPTTTLLGLAVAAVATLLFGGWPLLKASRQSLLVVLKGDGFQLTASSRISAGKFLVFLEAALSMVLLVAALLAIGSARRLLAIDPGFDPERVAVAAPDLAARGYSPGQADAFYSELLERIRRDPGVVAASLGSFLPFEGSLRWTVYPPAVATRNDAPELSLDIVDRGSFKTIGIPIVRGRDFRREDATSGAIIINLAMAKKLWPRDDPLGQGVSLDGPKGEILRVVGVVGDARYASLDQPPEPHFYLYRRFQDRVGLTAAFSTSLFLLVRAEGDPRSVLPGIRAALQSTDPDLPVPTLMTLDEHVARQTVRSRHVALLLGLLGGIGVLLAGVGLYGVMLSSLVARRGELAVRLAVGASPRSLMGLFLKQASLLTLGGIALGAGLAWVLSRLVEANVLGLEARSPFAYVIAGAVTWAASLAGTLSPALRAAREDVAWLLGH